MNIAFTQKFFCEFPEQEFHNQSQRVNNSSNKVSSVLTWKNYSPLCLISRSVSLHLNITDWSIPPTTPFIDTDSFELPHLHCKLDIRL